MAKAYQYYRDGFYFCEAEDHGRLPANATHTPPPPGPWHNLWPRFVDGAWVMVEDHRERSAALFGEHAQDATEYWLPDDDWQTPGRRMQKPGPLPAGASMMRPVKPAPTKAELFASLRRERDGRIAATDYLLMPDYPISDASRDALAVYRQALRDLPACDGAPWDGGGEKTPWPIKPEIQIVEAN